MIHSRAVKKSALALLLSVAPACRTGTPPAPPAAPVGPSNAPTNTRADREAAPDHPSAAAPAVVGVDVGQVAPDWSLSTVGGGSKLRLSDLRGQVVLVAFWATWCGPCRTELPALEAAYQSRKDRGFTVAALSVDDTVEAARAFLASTPLSFPVLWDPGGKDVSDPWGVLNLPMSFLIDPKGRVLEVHVGYTPKLLERTLALADEHLPPAP